MEKVNYSKKKIEKLIKLILKNLRNFGNFRYKIYDFFKENGDIFLRKFLFFLFDYFPLGYFSIGKFQNICFSKNIRIHALEKFSLENLKYFRQENSKQKIYGKIWQN